MYSVSNNYLNALAAPVKTFRLIGTVGTVSFDEGNIIDISIDNQVSEGSEIKIGSVYAGVLTATFNGLTIARGSWVGKTITLSEGLLIDPTTDTYEDVPLGVFTVAEANHTAEGVEVTAYDAMTAFDKTRNDLTDTGTAYAFLTLMCQKCGVTLGSTLADIQSLPNGTETFSIYAENDIETWRDLLSWIAQTLGAVATIGRDGKLYLRQYSMTAAATIDETHRFTGCSFSDFVTYYTGMSVVDIALRQTEYKSEVVDDGLTYNLGSNPLVQGHYEYVQEIIDDFSNVALTPFNAQMLGGAIYDLCDCLTFSGGIAAGATCGVMGYTWKYNGAYSVKGFGANPALASAKSKTQKELEALYNTVGQDINEMSVVQNSAAVSIAENTETSILKYNFEVTQEENTTMVDVSVVMTATATETVVGDVYTLDDIVAALTFYVDNSQVTVYDPTFIVDEGKDTMTFNYSLSGLSVGAHEFDIRLEMDGGSGSVAVGDVHEMLWGYGITFEVYAKSIQVAELPLKTTFFAGQRLNYTGIEVDLVYNNGLKNDVTSQCTFDPASGTVLTASDVGTLTVDVDYDTFDTTFQLNVELLGYDLERSASYLWETTPSLLGGDFVPVGSSLKAISIEKGLNVQYADLTVASDGTTTITDSGTLSHTFAGSRYGIPIKHGNIIYHQWSSNAAYNNKFFEMGYVDLENKTSGSMTVNVVYDKDPSATIFAFYRSSSNSFAQAFFVGDFLVFPCMNFTIKTSSTPYPSYTSYGIGVINGTTIAIHLMDPDDYDQSVFVNSIARGVSYDYIGKANGSFTELMRNDAEWFVTTDGTTIKFYHLNCTNYGLTYTLDYSYPSEIPTAGAELIKIAGTDVMYINAPGKYGLFDPDNGDYTEFDKPAGDFSKFAWDEDREMFFKYYTADYDSTHTRLRLYASADLQNWVSADKIVDYFKTSTGSSYNVALFPYGGHLMAIGRNSSASTGNKVVGAIVFEA